MEQERDSGIEALFAQADEALESTQFVNGVVGRIDARRRRVLAGRLTILGLLVALEALLDAPLQSSLGAFSAALGTDLVSIEHEWLSFLLAPINSVAGLLGMVLLGVLFLYRKFLY